MNTSTLSEPELVKWPSTEGAQISGFLYKPAAAVHGQTSGHHQHSWRPGSPEPSGLHRSQQLLSQRARRRHHLPERAWVVRLRQDVPESSTMGQSRASVVSGPRRAARLDQDETRSGCDRVLVTGGSYGGHMTLVAATQYNDRIRASVAVAAISNLVSNPRAHRVVSPRSAACGVRRRARPEGRVST